MIERIGRVTLQGIDTLGYHAALLAESLYWLFWGWRVQQPVRVNAVVAEMLAVGVLALPIVTVLSMT